jgi:hypothetical protein
MRLTTLIIVARLVFTTVRERAMTASFSLLLLSSLFS